MSVTSVTSLLKDNLLSNNFVFQLTWVDLVWALATAFICGLAIYTVYRRFHRGAFYNDNFNVLLMMVTMVTAFIITTVSSNLALSLGMVGALSIVRFRAAIKDPLDVGFVFWAVAAGLTAGAGLYLVALLGTLIITLVYLLMGLLKFVKKNYLIVVRYAVKNQAEINKILAKYHYVLKNKTVVNGLVELTIEIFSDSDLAEKLQEIKMVESVIKVEYNGDYVG